MRKPKELKAREDWRPILDRLSATNLLELFSIVDLITGAPAEVVFEVFRREGIDDFRPFLRDKTDDELKEYFGRFMAAPKAKWHYLNDLIYGKIAEVFSEVREPVMHLMHREVLFAFFRRRLLNAEEVLNMMAFQPELLDEAMTEVMKLETYKEIVKLAKAGRAVINAAKVQSDEYFGRDGKI